jgi:hypothetical protein
MGCGVAGIELQGLSELRFTSREIPTVLQLVDTQNRMRTRECGIELQGLVCRGVSLGRNVVGVARTYEILAISRAYRQVAN